ncbi:predicted protein [Sclerotinia sclerotiorum 1980 UF-70]|uniref:Uncharacterized protein n=1 Tax=Sclerotinia sclerotiorum (strain ATCC 18683 / 1980 / Ss-1) TaxID=665079 RepID=A7ER54_SCLS1|nr:predicted protein [Sclerotinia sclerotiorum 1980 UF-70]EDN91946.1 predicted protein [Sclerotinia sclerotiorum 1980 UF-70]
MAYGVGLWGCERCNQSFFSYEMIHMFGSLSEGDINGGGVHDVTPISETAKPNDETKHE